VITRYTDDPAVALRDTIAAIWRVVERATAEPDPSWQSARTLLARRELVQRGTYALSAVIRRGIEAGAFWPRCPEWATQRLPFAIVAGACARWVFGLSTGPSLRASTAVKAVFDVLQPVTPVPELAGIREKGVTDERRTRTGRYTQGSVRPDGGREAQPLGRERSPFRRLGDLPPQGIAGRS
jgi:hypothetical protein